MGRIEIVVDGIENDDYSYMPSLSSYIKSNGYKGLRNNTPIGRDADSLHCIMTLLGVPVSCIPEGRSVLEAIAVDLPVEDDDLVFRGNSVLIKEGILVSSCAKSSLGYVEEAGLRIKQIGEYKYLIILKGGKPFLDSITTVLPHQSMGRRLEELLPVTAQRELSGLRKLIDNYSIMPWGGSVVQPLPSFESLHKIKGAMVARTEIAVGIAKAMGMHCEVPKSATGDIDTDLSAKAEATLRLINEYKYVMLHINGTDECSHRKDKEGKREFIKRIDSELLLPILKNANEGTEIEITADHETSAETGRHINSQTRYFRLKL